MNTNSINVGVWLVAIFCALEGLFTIYYGFITIYAYSGFTSIFIGVATILIAVGLIKKHHIARVGAYVVFVISGLTIALILYVGLRPNEDGEVNGFGLLEYLCVIYIFLAFIAVIFLSLPSARKYFSLSNN
ncbi:MAG: hypothetical protein GKR92_09805 [Gammaproteobacteria bacterium]|nr:MAG: hypothetical protein GKR92_09805 [Gammaproteobacteria bacterium]